MSAGWSPSHVQYIKIKFFSAAVWAVMGLFLISCGQVSKEQQLIERFNKIADLAEDEDMAGIMNVLSQGYQDFEGRDKAATEEMIQGYFKFYRGIVFNVLGVRVTDLQTEEPSLEADVMISSGAAQALRRLIRFAGEYYRVKVRWIKEGDVWKVAYAAWQSVGLDDLFPDSRNLIR